MEITKELIDFLARQGGLILNDQELEKYQEELQSLDAFMSKISDEDLDHVKALVHLDQDHFTGEERENEIIGGVSTNFNLEKIHGEGNN